MDCFVSLAGQLTIMTPRTATLIGLTAILMWSLLARADGGERQDSARFSSPR